MEVGSNHDPAATGNRDRILFVVIVGIVGRECVENSAVTRASMKSGDLGQIPHFLGRGAGADSFVLHASVTVVHLEESFALHLGEIRGGERLAEVRVVQVREDRTIVLPAPGGDRIEVGLKSPLYRVPASGRNGLVDVDRIDVDLGQTMG